jgi:hypothetical protein
MSDRETNEEDGEIREGPRRLRGRVLDLLRVWKRKPGRRSFLHAVRRAVAAALWRVQR